MTLQKIVLRPPHLAGVEPEGLHEDAVLAHVEGDKGELAAELLRNLAQNESRDLSRIYIASKKDTVESQKNQGSQ